MLSGVGPNVFKTTHSLVAEAFIGPRPKGKFIDHIDRNPKNNRVSNLRYVTPSVNSHNTEKVKGFSWKKDKQKWKAYIVVNRIQYHLGYFETAEEAREAYLIEKKRLGLQCV